MLLVRLVYASTKSDDWPATSVQDILSAAKKYNARNYLTGILCFNRKYFLQSLEGSRDAVNETYRRIQLDPRHTNVLLLGYQEIASRAFDKWSMGFVPETSLTASTILRHSCSTDFNPYKLSGASADAATRQPVVPPPCWSRRRQARRHPRHLTHGTSVNANASTDCSPGCPACPSASRSVTGPSRSAVCSP